MRILFVAICVALISPAWANEPSAPTEESLVAAWEEIQRNDPQTIIFEKTDKYHYRFKTNVFPFDGELIIHDATVDSAAMKTSIDHYAVGTVAVEAVGWDPEKMQYHARKYSIWARNNQLYFQQSTGKWITNEQFYANAAEHVSMSQEHIGAVGNTQRQLLYGFMVFLAMLYVFIYRRNAKLLAISRASIAKQTKENQDRIDQSIAAHEETNRLLNELILELKKQQNG